MSKFTQVVKRSGAMVPFNPDRITNAIYRAAVAVGGRDKERAAWLSVKVVTTLEETTPPGQIPHIEQIQNIVEKILVENGHAQVAKEYILYRDERSRRRKAEAKGASQPSEYTPWAKIWRILDWAVSHGVHTVEALNQRIANGEFAHIVHESEAAYEDDVNTAVDMIAERRDEIKIVLVTGPSSSGKTTTTEKIERRLKGTGLKLVTLNVDNYFFDLEMHPKDEFGDYDFETPQALDLPMINEHLQGLIEGKKVLVPFYDFKTGLRKLNHTPMKLDASEILLIDSLHGLYPTMTAGIPNQMKFKLYLEPLLQMKDPDGKYVRWTDLRLIRRMLRDSIHRAYSPEQTLLHWHYVRTSEMRHIIPYNSTVDFIINSGMPYELPLYSARLSGDFEGWATKYKDDTLREDAYIRASLISKLLQEVEPVEDDSPIPPDSVMREFI